MMNGGYLVPANAKKGTLIFNMFRGIDLIIFVVGVLISLLLLSIAPTNDIVMIIIFLLPGLICGFLVIPIPNYHNVLCAIQSIIAFYSNQRSYKWRGWCFNEQFTNDDKSKSNK